MRKIIIAVNNEQKLDYKEKIKFKINNNNTSNLSFGQQVAILKFLKENGDIQNFIMFNFLYYLGLSFSSISRILITHFNNNYSLLKLKHGKLKGLKINPSISKYIINFLKEKKENFKFLFYGEYIEFKNDTRTNYIKGKFNAIIEK